MNTKERLMEILEYCDWEGGLDEVILNMDGPNAVSGVSEELDKLAKEAYDSWKTFEKVFDETCEKYGAYL